MPNNKTTRTAAGSGSIRQRPNGRWEARLTLGYDEGTGKRKTLSIYGATQKEVKKKMTEKLRQLDTNTFIADDKRTLAQYLDTWFAEFIEPTQKPYTVTTYRGVIKNHLKPNLGAVRLCDLTTEQVQKMVRKLVKAKLAPKTIKNIMTVLNSALEQAVKAQTLQRNPAKYAKIPAVRVKEIHTFTIQEIADFVDAAQDSPYYAPLMCCLFLGLREGDDDDKIRLNQRKPSKYKGLRRFGPEKNLQRINKFMKERPIFYKNLIQMKENIRFYLRCFYCITKVMILQFNSENRTELARNG